MLQWHPDRNPADRETAEECGETAEHRRAGKVLQDMPHLKLGHVWNMSDENSRRS